MKAKAIIMTGLVAGLLGSIVPVYAHPEDNDRPQYQIQSSPNAASSGQVVAPYSAPNQPPAPVSRASNLIGMKVRNTQNQTLGTVKDVVFDLQTGRISYVVLKKAGRNYGTGEYAAVPPSALMPSQDMRHLILNTDKTALQHSQGFSRNNYPPVGETAFGAPPQGVGQGQGQGQQEILIVPIEPSPGQQNQDQMPNSPDPNLPENQNNQEQNPPADQQPLPSPPSAQ